MTRTQIIAALKPYFPSVRELVCPHTYAAFGESKSWQFLSTEYLHCLLVIRRDILKAGMVCNNYHSSGPYSQRGNRCNICQLVKDKTNANKIYLSAHVTGNGGDFTITKMSAAEARNKIKANACLLPYPIRMELDVTWLHFDVYDALNGQKITEFNG